MTSGIFRPILADMTKHHRDIIAFWDGPDALAEAIGFKFDRVRKWRQRGIPSGQWQAIITAAERRGIALTWAMFAGQEPLPAKPIREDRAA